MKTLALASEDHINIAHMQMESWRNSVSLTFTMTSHSYRFLLAFACDDRDGTDDSSQEAGAVMLCGLPNDS